MKEHCTYLVPNLYINGLPLPPETPAATVAKNKYLEPLVVQSLQKAYKAGVNMALGTDSGVYAHGENGREFAALVANGVSELHALWPHSCICQISEHRHRIYSSGLFR
jgi:imidazolonepropionase-like amidohydrolase